MSTADVSIQVPQREVERETLTNGTTMLYTPNAYNRIVAVRIFSRHASRHETEDQAGIANLAMRMLSTGTQQHSENELAELLERNGAHFKAEAGKDWSSIDLLTTVDSLDDDLSVLMELLNSATYREEKLVRERELVRMNILEDEDSKLTYTMRQFNKKYYGTHPYAWPSLGRVEALEEIDRDAVAAFGARSCDPANLVLTVVGGSETSSVKKRIYDAFSDRQSNGRSSIETLTPFVPAFAKNEEQILYRESEAEYVILGYPGCGLADERSLVLRVIATVLGGSMDSRLFREIRDKRGLCYQVGSNYSPHIEHSPLLIYTVTSPENREDAVRCAEAEIERLQAEPVSEEELLRVQTYLVGTYVMSMESNMGQASRLGAYEISGLGWDYANRFSSLVYGVTAEQIQAVAREMLTNRLLTITSPVRGEGDTLG